MHIAIEATTLTKTEHEGTGRYAQMLLDEFAAITSDAPTRVTRLCHLSHIAGVRALRAPGQSVRLWHERWLPAGRYDVVHAASHRLPARGAAVRIATIHDVYPALGINAASARATQKGIARLQRLRELADHVVCVSAMSRTNWLEHFDFPPENAHVVHLGVSGRFRPMSDAERAQVRRQHCAGEPYLLFLGAFRPNKNIERLIQAYAASPLRRDMKLLIAGRIEAPDLAKLQDWLDRLDLRDRVVLTGYFADADLPGLYAAAAALLLPSLYEGFGLPILEAMASGTPVLTSITGSCPEVAAGHAVLVDPLSVDAIRDGLDQVTRTSPAAVDGALRYARSKSWTQTARQTLAVYRAALGASSARR